VGRPGPRPDGPCLLVPRWRPTGAGRSCGRPSAGLRGLPVAARIAFPALAIRTLQSGLDRGHPRRWPQQSSAAVAPGGPVKSPIGITRRPAYLLRAVVRTALRGPARECSWRTTGRPRFGLETGGKKKKKSAPAGPYTGDRGGCWPPAAALNRGRDRPGAYLGLACFRATGGSAAPGPAPERHRAAFLPARFAWRLACSGARFYGWAAVPSPFQPVAGPAARRPKGIVSLPSAASNHLQERHTLTLPLRQPGITDALFFCFFFLVFFCVFFFCFFKFFSFFGFFISVFYYFFRFFCGVGV